jgi:hypothetical protein
VRIVTTNKFWRSSDALTKSFPGSRRALARVYVSLERAGTPASGDYWRITLPGSVAEVYCARRVSGFDLWLWYTVLGDITVLYSLRDVPPPAEGP